MNLAIPFNCRALSSTMKAPVSNAFSGKFKRVASSISQTVTRSPISRCFWLSVTPLLVCSSFGSPMSQTVYVAGSMAVSSSWGSGKSGEGQLTAASSVSDASGATTSVAGPGVVVGAGSVRDSRPSLQPITRAIAVTARKNRMRMGFSLLLSENEGGPVEWMAERGIFRQCGRGKPGGLGRRSVVPDVLLIERSHVRVRTMVRHLPHGAEHVVRAREREGFGQADGGLSAVFLPKRSFAGTQHDALGLQLESEDLAHRQDRRQGA